MNAALARDATAATIAGAVARREVAAADVVEAALRRIMDSDGGVNAFTDVLDERAEARAEALDAALAGGAVAGPLAGVPFAVKNLFDIAGLSTRAGSKINIDAPPAQRDALLIQRLEAAGAILVGGVNMGEYAYDFTGENAHYGPSRNPHDLTRMTGGSSGGSGAAVASAQVPLALGSDTNGSIRVPASFCGLFGLKPTYGRLSRTGSFLFVDSLDHLGPLARSAADLALAFDAMQGPDAADPVCTLRPASPTWSNLAQGLDGLRIARLGGHFARDADPAAFAAVDKIASALQVTREAILPEVDIARAAAYAITMAEAGALHLPRLRARAADYDPATRERFMAGALLPAAWYLKAQRFRRRFQVAAQALFRDHDVLLAPATPCTAPRIGQVTMNLAGVEQPVRARLGLFTQPISLLGLPVVVVPTRTPGGLPIGVQVIAAPFNEQAALRVAAWLEQAGVTAAAPAAEAA